MAGAAIGKEFAICEFDLEIVHIEPDFSSELFVYASTHRSEVPRPCFTVHIPGNWGAADLGGQMRTLNIADACAMKAILLAMQKYSAKSNLGWPVYLEVDHHGPTIPSPLCFAEIGSSVAEWQNEVAGEVVAKSIMEGLRSTKKYEVALGFGGGHYSPAFTKIMLDENAPAIAHVLPKYRINGFDAQMLAQAIEKSTVKPTRAIIDWKGLDKPGREKVIGLLKEAGMEWEKA
jgi:D-aminoacyl-tRNA deacylase